MVDAIPAMLATLREGLATIGHPDSSTSAFIERLVLLHQQILDSPPRRRTSGQRRDRHRIHGRRLAGITAKCRGCGSECSPSIDDLLWWAPG